MLFPLPGYVASITHRLSAALRFVPLLYVFLASGLFAGEPLSVSGGHRDGDFNLAGAGHAADLFVDRDDSKVVHLAADCFAADVERVSGAKPRVSDNAKGLSENAVLIGTAGKSALIDDLARSGKIDLKSVEGKWESFMIATVRDPLPGVKMGLVIVGSDRRGTAYGVFEVSEAIGVSPWVWWADVAPAHRDTLFIGSGAHTLGPPSVKYRGLFINDEDWGLQPWAAKTFEPETKDIGPKTYAKVCELLLRLKANYLWPAMHPCTKAFNLYPENKLVADDYAIVMGSSHAEPMLRNNVSEWTLPKDDWNYDTNRDAIDKYWALRVQENGRYENVYTVGMRGVHDSPMPGGGTMAEKVARLERVIADQREILAKEVNPNVEQVPQAFVPYKEALVLYQNGLKVPDDVTLIWPDDNFGYIRELSNLTEQKRRGGGGVYYHFSYWGAPEDYLWLCTTPPVLTWEEMSKAYDNGARAVWVANVGDIKPAEVDLDFFLRMAWDITPWNENAQPTFLAQWAERTFGKEHAAEIAAIMDGYYRLNYPSKPEHLLLAQFTANYEETGHRLEQFRQLVEKTNALYAQLPREQKDAFYELVVYPVRCSSLMNEKCIGAPPEHALEAYDQIQEETKYYNEQVAGGKWRNIMSANSRKRPVYQKPDLSKAPESGLAPDTDGSPSDDSTVSIEAEHPTRATDAGAAKWKVIAGLGRTGDSIALLPTTAPVGDAALEYDFTIAKAGAVKALVYCIPTHALYSGTRLRYAISVDGAPEQTVDIETEEFSKNWSANVLRNAAIGTTELSIDHPGKHTLKLRAVDPGVVFDKIVVDAGAMKPSQLGPPETARP